MGLLKRDLARASAESLPELGGVFCSPRQLLCICRSMLPPSSSLPKATQGRPCSYTSCLCSVTWQFCFYGNSLKSTADLLHIYTQPCWPVTLAPYLRCITYTPTSLHSHPQTYSAFSTKPWPTYRHFERSI